MQRSLQDSLMVVQMAYKTPRIVAGGGACEMSLANYSMKQSKSIQGKLHFLIKAFARSLEIIPTQLCRNAGFDATDILKRLRYEHNTHEKMAANIGVDLRNGLVCNTYDANIWENLSVKRNALQTATESACLII